MGDFVKVATSDDLSPGQMKMVEVDGQEALLTNLNGQFYAISNICTHSGGSLAEGYLEGREIECPLHGARFDIKTGEVLGPPADEPQACYETRVDGHDILVKKAD